MLRVAGQIEGTERCFSSAWMHSWAVYAMTYVMILTKHDDLIILRQEQFWWNEKPHTICVWEWHAVLIPTWIQVHKFLILISGLTKIHDSDSSSNWFWFQCDPKNLIPISASCDSESNKAGFDANSQLSFQFRNHLQPWIEYVNSIHIQYPLLVWILTPWFKSIVMPTQ